MPTGGKGARGREGGRLCLFPQPLQSPPRAHMQPLVALEGFFPGSSVAANSQTLLQGLLAFPFQSCFGFKNKTEPESREESYVQPCKASTPCVHTHAKQRQGAPSGCAHPDVCTCPPRRVWQPPQPFPSPPPPATKQEETVLPLSKLRGRRGSLVAQAWQSCPQNLPALPHPQARALRFAPPAASPRELPHASRERNSQFPGSRQLKPSRTLLLKPKH